MARFDGPWHGPIFSQIQAGLPLSEETERHLELLVSASAESGMPHMVSSVEESESESDSMVVEMEGISYD